MLMPWGHEVKFLHMFDQFDSHMNEKKAKGGELQMVMGQKKVNEDVNK